MVRLLYRSQRLPPPYKDLAFLNEELIIATARHRAKVV